MVGKDACDPGGPVFGQGSNGTETLREEVEAENEGIKVRSTVRWLSGAPSVKARFKERTIKASSVVLAVADEDTFRLVCRMGLRLQGRVYDTEAYEEVRPDVGCGRCCEWGHIEAQCPRTAARCGWCAEGHKTSEHSCPAEGCRLGRATGASTPWQSAGTAGALTSPRLMPARRRGPPAGRRKGGDPPAPRGGSKARPRG